MNNKNIAEKLQKFPERRIKRDITKRLTMFLFSLCIVLSAVETDSLFSTGSVSAYTEECKLCDFYATEAFVMNKPFCGSGTPIDINNDGNIDVFDLCIMREKLDLSEDIAASACNILDGLEVYVQSLSGKPAQTVLSSVCDYLGSIDGIAEIKKDGDTIYFTTDGGFNSFFRFEEEDETEQENYGTVSESIKFSDAPEILSDNDSFRQTTDSSLLLKKFDKNRLFEFDSVVTDPDVLVICPISSVESFNQSGNSVRKACEELAQYLGGKCDIVTEDMGFEKVSKAFHSWENYGTVAVVSHSGYSSDLQILIKRSSDSEPTKDAYSYWKETYDFDFTEKSLYGEENKEYQKENEILQLNLSGFSGYGLSYCAHRDKEKDIIIYPIHYDMFLYGSYLEYIYSNSYLPNTILYLSSCDSIKCDDFNTYMKGHGISCILGYDNHVHPLFEADKYTALTIKKAMLTAEGTETGNYKSNFTLGQSAQSWEPVVKTNSSEVSLAGNENFVYYGCGVLTGNVIDNADNPCGNATVKAYRYLNGKLEQKASAKTDSEGKYIFSALEWGIYLIQAYNETNEAFLTVEFCSPYTKNEDIIISDKYSFQIKITDTDGTNLSDAEIIIDGEAESPLYSSCGICNTMLTAGEHSLSVSKDGYISQTKDFTIKKSPSHTEIELEKEKFDVVIRIEDENGSPVKDAKISIAELPFYNAATDSKGNWSYSLPNGTYKISISKSGYESYKGSFTVENSPFSDTITIKSNDFLEYQIYDDCAIVSGCNDKTVSSVEIPQYVNGVPVIGILDNVFEGCTALSDLTVPDTVYQIGYAAFGVYKTGTKVMGEAWESDDNKKCTAWFRNQPDGLVYAGSAAYRYKGTYSFIETSRTYNSDGYIINQSTDNVSSMPENSEIVLKSGTRGISGSCFDKCRNMVSVYLPDSLEYIGVQAFNKCSGLTQIYIPENVWFIGSGAFANCENIKSIYFGGSEAEWNEIISFYTTYDLENDAIYNANIYFNCER